MQPKLGESDIDLIHSQPAIFVLSTLGGGILVFAIRRWITTAIDAKFKTQMEVELSRVRHEFNLAVERHKNDLAKEFQSHLRELDRSGKTKDRSLQANINLYEAYRTHFGALVINIQTFRCLREFYSEQGIFDKEQAALIEKATKALEIVNQNNLYAPPYVTVGISETYAAIVKCLIAGVNDDQVDKVISDVSALTARMRVDLEWPKK